MDQLVVNGLDFKAYAAIIGHKIADLLSNKNNEAVQSILDTIEITNKNKDVRAQSLQQKVMFAACEYLPEFVLPLLQFAEKYELNIITNYNLFRI